MKRVRKAIWKKLQEVKDVNLYLWYAFGYQTVINKELEMEFHVRKPKQQMKLQFRKNQRRAA